MEKVPLMFVETINNSLTAIKEKRYDILAIAGNRLLSDLAIFEKAFNDHEGSFLALVGLFLRRTGIDLLNLSESKNDTAKLRQRTAEAISKMRACLKSDGPSSVREAIDAYRDYDDAWADAVNSNDFAQYYRGDTLDKDIFEWAIKGLNSAEDSEILAFSYPISAISNELARLSYMQKLSVRTTVLSIGARALEMLSVATNQVVDIFRSAVSDSERGKELIIVAEKVVVKFAQDLERLFSGIDARNTKDLSDDTIERVLKIVKAILITWRELINKYFQINTGFQKKMSEQKEEEQETEEDIEKSLLRKQHKRIPK